MPLNKHSTKSSTTQADNSDKQSTKHSTSNNQDYTGKSISVLDHCEAIRRYAGMYIGCVKDGNHLIMEVIDNAIDECIMNYCDCIKVEFHEHNKVTISDNGRGIPIDRYNDQYLACEIVLLTIHAGGKFNENTYVQSGGLHGIGLSAVAALSASLEVVINRDGKVCTMHLEKGVLKSTVIVDSGTDETGTSITIVPDPEIFDSPTFTRADIRNRLWYLSFLNHKLTIDYIDHVDQHSETMVNKEGIAGLVNEQTKSPALKNNIVVQYDDDEIKITTVINWDLENKEEKIFAFTNCIMQPEGGIHVQSTKSGFIEFISGLKDITDIDEEGIIWNDIKAGVRCGIDLRMRNPKYNAQSKLKLISSAIRKRIESATKLTLHNIYTTNANALEHIISMAQANLIKRNTKVDSRHQLSAFLHEGRLVDCRSQEPEKNEIFLVEGESAGGPVKQCRDRMHQAVLTLRGKILNVEKAALKQIIKSDALNVIITAIGGKRLPDGTIDLSKIKYHKILILVDSDVDGDHIVSLILTFFYRYMREVIEKNYLYIVQPPLYAVTIRGSKMYFKRHSEIISFMTDISTEKDFKGKKINLTEKDLIATIFHMSYDTTELSNRFITKIIDTAINEGITTFDKLIELFDTVAKHVLIDEHTTDCYINSRQQIVIEDYRTTDKLLLTRELFEQKILAIIKSLENYSKELTSLKDKLNIQYPVSFINSKFKKNAASIEIQRFKGLGEMNADQLYETSMCPEKRIIKKVTLKDSIKADATCNILMGIKVEARRQLIHDSSMIAEAT